MLQRLLPGMQPIKATRVVELHAGRAEGIERARAALRRLPRSSDPSVDHVAGVVKGEVHWRWEAEYVTIRVTELDPGRSRVELEVGSERRGGRRDEDVVACVDRLAEYVATPAPPFEQSPASDNRQFAAICVALVAGWVVAIPLAVAFGASVAGDNTLTTLLVFEAPFLVTMAVSGRHFELHGARQWIVAFGLTLIAAPILLGTVQRLVSGLTGGGWLVIRLVG